MQLIDRITAFQHEIRAIRRDLHAHPELRFEEHRTADMVAARAAGALAVAAGWGHQTPGIPADHFDVVAAAPADVARIVFVGA